MGRIIIFEEGPGSDDTWIGILLFVLYILGAIAIWPMVISSYNTAESEVERKEILTIAGVVLIACACIMLLYIILADSWSIAFTNAFWVICSLTTIIAGSIFLIMSIEGGFFTIFLMTFLLAGAPSFFAACICVLWKESRWKK
ncbi:MAG: hypothetical protein IKL28_09830 [Lachnospiraceae bacterium]|nr:hypothetical protein [Lachnospiraceae bacterium]